MYNIPRVKTLKIFWFQFYKIIFQYFSTTVSDPEKKIRALTQILAKISFSIGSKFLSITN